jgi:hypothetical protein
MLKDGEWRIGFVSYRPTPHLEGRSGEAFEVRKARVSALATGVLVERISEKTFPTPYSSKTLMVPAGWLVVTTAKPGGCFAAGTRVAVANGQVPIEQVAVGQRVLTLEPADDQPQPVSAEAVIDPPAWRQVTLLLDRGSGDWIDLKLLRPLTWLDARSARLGAALWINLPEIGLEGRTWVQAIDSCPALEQGPGRLVTGTFRHTFGLVHDLQVEGEPKPVVMTGSHPFWSLHRRAWAAASELRPGEPLKGQRGPARVSWLGLVPREASVYNLEVDADHCYRIGLQGLLVHNSSIRTRAGAEFNPFLQQGGVSLECAHQSGRYHQFSGSRPLWSSIRRAVHLCPVNGLHRTCFK